MKKISVLIPCYNEAENVGPISRAVTEILEKELPQYDYELVFIDNDSTDGTRDIIRGLCADNPRIKAILNARNFGQFNSPYYGMLQVTGDCVIEMVADFQDPVEMIPKYIHEWEKGYKIVIGIKTSSKENRLMYWLRSCYYKTIKKLSDVEQIEHFTGSGLYDREFIEVLRNLDDPTPFLRGIVAELGYRRKEIPYEQPRRRAGKTHNNFYRLYDAAMLSVTSYTKAGLRLATIFGSICAVVSMLIAMVYLVMKLIWWDRFPAGMAPMLIGMLFLGSVQLFFIGFLGEYIMSINQRVMKRPLVIEEERINFNEEEKKEMYCKRLGDIRLTKEAGELLERIEWKGNIRQLNNICMRLIVNSDTDEIGAKEIYSVLNQEEWTDGAPAGEQAPGEVNLEDRGEVNNAGAKMAAAAHLREPEETARIREALDYYSYNRQKTAKALGMSRSTI